MVACTQPGLLEQIEMHNRMLDEVMKCLEAYLETKRIAFPRFFFLSNDELLEILAQVSVKRENFQIKNAKNRIKFPIGTIIKISTTIQ